MSKVLRNFVVVISNYQKDIRHLWVMKRTRTIKVYIRPLICQVIFDNLFTTDEIIPVSIALELKQHEITREKLYPFYLLQSISMAIQYSWGVDERHLQFHFFFYFYISGFLGKMIFSGKVFY